MATPTTKPVEFFLVIRPEHIGWLRFLLEGYDGLAVLTTLSVAKGLVRLRTLDCNYAEAMRLMEALAPKLTWANGTIEHQL